MEFEIRINQFEDQNNKIISNIVNHIIPIIIIFSLYLWKGIYW